MVKFTVCDWRAAPHVGRVDVEHGLVERLDVAANAAAAAGVAHLIGCHATDEKEKDSLVPHARKQHPRRLRQQRFDSGPPLPAIEVERRLKGACGERDGVRVTRSGERARPATTG